MRRSYGVRSAIREMSKGGNMRALLLTAGRHTITLMPVGYLCVGTLTITSD